jgi:hypothetical protein
MTNPFVEANLPANSQLRTAEALERLKAAVEAKLGEGWEPNAGDLGVIILETIGPMSASLEILVGTVLSAIFRRYGTKLFNLPYNEGAAATGVTSWTLADTAGHTILAGTQLEISGFGFQVTESVVVAKGSSVASSVPIVAVARGTEYNGLTGVADVLEPQSWVTEVQVVGETSDGAEQEDDEEYEGRLTSELALQAPRPINAEDFAPFVLGVPSNILPSGVIVGRATAIDGYDASTSETGIERCTTTWVTDEKGKALSSEAMTALETWLAPYLPFNALSFIRAPAYEEIYVTYTVALVAGYNAETLIEQIDKALELFLSSFLWANPNGAVNTAGKSEWVTSGYEKVRYNAILGVIQKVKGVNYVPDGSAGLAIGTSPSPSQTADITLSGGEVVLPEIEPAYIKGSVS